MEKIKDFNPEYITLKERSPSCGSSTIYIGDFNGHKKMVTVLQQLYFEEDMGSQ